jgi:hypothetical protein
MFRSRNRSWLQSLLRSWFPARTAPVRRRRCPLWLEPLEDRLTPSSYTVTDASDTTGSASDRASVH